MQIFRKQDKNHQDLKKEKNQLVKRRCKHKEESIKQHKNNVEIEQLILHIIKQSVGKFFMRNKYMKDVNTMKIQKLKQNIKKQGTKKIPKCKEDIDKGGTNKYKIHNHGQSILDKLQFSCEIA